MSLTTNQQPYLARRLAKAHGLFVVVKTHTFGSDRRTDYILYRELSHARPTPIGKRESAAALLALVEKSLTAPPAGQVAQTRRPRPSPLITPIRRPHVHHANPRPAAAASRLHRRR